MLKKYRLMGRLILTAMIAFLLATCFIACTKKNEENGGGSGKKEEPVVCEDHSYGGWQIVTEATCTTEGKRKRVCSVCGEVDEETFYAEHTLTKTSGKAATCTEEGNVEYYTCSVCHKLFSNASASKEIRQSATVIAAKGHTLVHKAAVEATCAREGSVEHWQCSVCDAKFSDAAGTTAITTVATAKKAHTLTKVGGKSADCDSEGEVEHWHCSVCENDYSDENGTQKLDTVIIPITHGTLTAYEAVQATCTQEGNIAYWVCPVCSRYFYDAQAKREIVDKVTVVPMVPHEFIYHAAVENTCTHDGNVEYWGCKNCDTKYSDAAHEHAVVEVVIPRFEHTMTYHPAVAATCTEEGNVAYYACSVCQKNYSDKNGTTVIENVVVAKVPHEIEEIDAAVLSCVGGNTYFYCKNCASTFSDAEGTTPYTVGETTHNMTYHNVGFDATCTTAGEKEYWQCDVCNKKYLDEKGVAIIADADVVIPAYNHDVMEDKQRVEATCTANGIEAHKYCSRCGEYFTINGDATTEDELKIAALGHNEVQDAAVPATCTATGLTQGSHCSRCGEVLTAQTTTEMIPHSYTNGTCTVCEAHKPVRITFEEANDYATEERTISANEAFELPVPVKTAEDYFVGWAFGTTMVTDDHGKSITEWTWNNYDDTLLTAIWDYADKRNCVKIIYQKAYDAKNTNVGIHKKGYTVPLAALTGRTGYDFVEWSLAGSGVDEIAQEHDVYLEAVWAIQTYTITFDPQGGTLAETTMDVEYNADLDVASFTAPTFTGKTFLGWYLSFSDETVYAGKNMPAYDFTLYAKWTEYKILSVEYKSLTAIKASDTLNAELFGINMTDTDGSHDATVTVDVIESKEEGKLVSVKITVVGKYGKKKIITLSDIRVYSVPTLIFTKDGVESENVEFTDYSVKDKLDAAYLNASGKDTFGGDTVVTVHGLHNVVEFTAGKYSDLTAEQKAQTVSVGNEKTALLYAEGDNGVALIRNASTYKDEWEYLLDVDGNKILYDVYGVTGATVKADVYGYAMLKKADVYLDGDNFSPYGTYTVAFDFGGATPEETFVIRSIDVVGNVKEKQVSGVKVYTLPSITFAHEIVGVKKDAEITAELWGATAADSFGTAIENVTFEKTGSTAEVGNVVTVTFTATDSQGNIATKIVEVKVLGTPTLDRPEKTRFTVGQTIDATTIGIKAKDSFGDLISDVSVVKASGDESVAGSYVHYTVTATDVAGNVLEKDVTVMIYGDPTIEIPATVAVSTAADISDPASFGVTAKDDFDKELTVIVTLKSGTFEKGESPVFTFTASNVAGKTVSVDQACPVYGRDDIDLSYNPGQSRVVRLSGDCSEFSATATGTNGSACTVKALLPNGNALVAGTVTNIILRATDAAGNYVDSDVIADVSVYDVPQVSFTKNPALYLSAAEAIAYENHSLSFDAMFSAIDSFGEPIDLNFVETEKTAEKLTVSVTSDPDTAGNVFTESFEIALLAEDQSILVLTVGGEEKSRVRITKGNTNVELAHEYEGYTFNGWKLNDTTIAGNDGIVASWTEDAGEYIVTADVTSKQYNVSLYVEGTRIGASRVTYGQNYTLTLPSLGAGQRFIGWILNDAQVTDGEGHSLAVWSKTEDDLYLEAEILTIQSVVELLNVNGVMIGTRTLLYGETFEIEPSVEEGYVFEGWFFGDTAITDKDGKSLARWTRTGAKYTLTARRRLVGYTINYHLNGGINDESNPVEYSATTVGSGISLADPVKVSEKQVTYSIDYSDGGYDVETKYTTYTFGGWYNESTFTNRVRVVTVEMGNLELYAKWIKTEETLTTDVAYLYNDDGTVSYGVYPQELVTDEELIATLTVTAGTLPDSSNDRLWTLFNYYIDGSDAAHFMWYYDYLNVAANKKYRGIYFVSYRPNDINEQATAGKSYQDDNGFTTGTVYWFEYKPIVWNVLSVDNGTALIYTDTILDARQMDETGTTYIGSSMDEWLNVGFLSTSLFTFSRQAIVTSEIDGSDRDIFLLSKADLTNAGYGFNASEGATDVKRRQKVSPYAACMGAYVIEDGTFAENGSWWLRTASDANRYYMVGYNGTIAPESYTKTYYGVAPAARISSSLLYAYDDVADAYTVTGYNGFEKEIVIPDTYQGKAVTKIGKYAFWGSDLISVVLPDSIVEIGDHAFYDCVNLVSITLPSNLASIGTKAFYGCVRLVEVINSSSLTIEKGGKTNGYVGYYAKKVNGSVTTLSFDNGFVTMTVNSEVVLVAYFGSETVVTVPATVTEIGKYAFLGCDKVTKIVIGEDVESIDATSFAFCSSLAEVVLPVSNDTAWYYTTSKSSWESKDDGVVFDGTINANNARWLKEEGGYLYKKTVTP